jgi:hypothetical protein
MSAPNIINPPAGGGGGTPVGGSGSSPYVAKWSGTSTLTTGILVDTGSSVGILQTSPVTTFQVGGNTVATPSPVGAFCTLGSNSRFTADDGTRAVTLAANGTDAIVGTTTAHDLLLQRGNVTAITLGASGAVTFAGNLTSSAAQTWALATGTSALNIASNLLNLDTTNSRVGVGTASPAALLHVNGSMIGGAGASATPYQQSLFGASSAYSMWWRTSATAGGGIVGSAGPGLQFYVVSGSPAAPAFILAATIDSTGSVGIGTASPTGRLHVDGGTASSGNGTPITLIAQNGQASGNTNGGNIVLTPGSPNGSGTPGLVDLSSPSGTGLKLPATPGNADANTIDCYVDGGASAGGVSWTPTLSAAGTWGGTAPTVTNARYTRIGNMVFCTVTLDATASTAFSSTYGSSTITAPAGVSAAVFTAVPSNRAGASHLGAQSGTTIFVPTYASSTNVINITWFYAV